jgi:MFS family permease
MKNLKALIFLFLANTVSGFSQGITMIAIPWVLVNGGAGPNGKLMNASMVATVTLLSLFWGLYAGTLIDKYNRKHIFLTLNGVDSLILLSVAAFGFWSGGVPFPLMALVFCITIFTFNVHYPNLYAFVQELFEPRLYGKVNSAIELQGQITNFLGMMAGGMLLTGTPDFAWWPTAWDFEAWPLHRIFLLDGITYAAAFFLISQIPYRPDPDRTVDQGNVLRRIRLGFDYLKDHRPLLLFGIASFLIFFSILVLVQVMLPVYVNDYLQEEAVILASFEALFALGAAMAGIMGLTALIRRSSIIKQVILLLLSATVIYLVSALTHSVRITLIAAVFLGICNAGARILRITYIVSIVPNRVIGRVNSFFNVVNVLMRFTFISLLTIPFFSGEGNGGNIIYAFLLLAGILFIGAMALIFRFQTFEQRAMSD